MPFYKLFKNGEFVNVIVAEPEVVDLPNDQYDSYEEIIPLSEPLVPLVKTWSDSIIRNNLTFAEKVKWDNNADPAIVTAKIDLPQERMYIEELLSYLVSANVISQSSATKILAL